MRSDDPASRDFRFAFTTMGIIVVVLIVATILAKA